MFLKTKTGTITDEALRRFSRFVAKHLKDSSPRLAYQLCEWAHYELRRRACAEDGQPIEAGLLDIRPGEFTNAELGNALQDAVRLVYSLCDPQVGQVADRLVVLLSVAAAARLREDKHHA